MLRRRQRTLTRPDSGGAARAGERALGKCPAGTLVLVVRLDCVPGDARRLRPLGVYEGACLRVISSGNGTVLDVRGSRLALDPALALAITVEPVVL